MPISKIKGGEPIFGWVTSLSADRFGSYTARPMWQWYKPQSLSFWYRGWNGTGRFLQRSEHMMPWCLLAFQICEPVQEVESPFVFFKRDGLLKYAYCNGIALGCIILAGLVGNEIYPFLVLAVLGIWWIFELWIYSASKRFCICTGE